MIFRDATLLQVTQSVTRNGKSIMLTMMLALILIYLFSLVGFIFFRDDFLTHVQASFYSSYRSRRSNNNNHSNSKAMILTRRSNDRCSGRN
jgi:DNA-binding response OmpR family regulator